VVEHLLTTGEQARELSAYFGAGEYAALAELAREAQKIPIAPNAVRVYIVPGIMGSQLGRMRRAPLPNDILWLDPVDISLGQLALLRLPVEGTEPVQADEHKHVPLQGEPQEPQETRIVSLGVVLFTYLRLKLQLRIAGFAPVFHDYDWRLGIDELGRALADRIRADRSRTMIVGHSMGGLVSRAALKGQGLDHVERVVLLGTPNSGSFAPVLALRGVYAVVRKIARLAQNQTAESLAEEVFSTFPSLYHLLPVNAEAGQDLFDAASWPSNGPTPNVPLLTRARQVLKELAAGDARFINIIGAGQETVTRATRKNGEFVYTITRQGDGTVPLSCAELPGARTYYTTVAHSELARDAEVAKAIADVLHSGETQRLQSTWSRNGKAEARITDTQLRRTHTEKVDFVQMEPEARQAFLRNLNEPPNLKLQVPVAKPGKEKTPTRRKTTRAKRRPASAKRVVTKAPPGRKPTRSKRKAKTTRKPERKAKRKVPSSVAPRPKAAKRAVKRALRKR